MMVVVKRECTSHAGVFLCDARPLPCHKPCGLDHSQHAYAFPICQYQSPFQELCKNKYQWGRTHLKAEPKDLRRKLGTPLPYRK